MVRLLCVCMCVCVCVCVFTPRLKDLRGKAVNWEYIHIYTDQFFMVGIPPWDQKQRDFEIHSQIGFIRRGSWHWAWDAGLGISNCERKVGKCVGKTAEETAQRCSQPEKLWPTLWRPLGGSTLINLSPSGQDGGIFIPDLLSCWTWINPKGSWLKGVSEQDQKELTVKVICWLHSLQMRASPSLKGHLASTSLCLPQVEKLIRRTFSLEREKV